MSIIAYKIYTNNELTVIESSDNRNIKSNNLDELLKFLYTEDDNLHIVWDLDQSVAPLLKLIEPKKLKKLNVTAKCHIAPFNIFYSKTRTLILQPVISGYRSCSIYGINQYFPELPPVRELSEIAQQGAELLSVLNQMGISEVRKLSSPVAIYEDAVMKHLKLPTVYDMPEEAAYYAAQCAGKLWVEAFKIGYWEEAYDYDLNSAFPSEILELPSFTFNQWQKTELFETLFGFWKCRVRIFESTKISPIIYIDEQDNLSTPTGEWNTYLTTEEIKFINMYNIGKVKVIDGWILRPSSKYNTLRIHIKDLLKWKQSNNKLISNLAKRMSVGIYGKFGEEYENKFGKYYNPAWFAYISTNVRLKIARFIYENNLQNNIIHISTDGILLDKEILLEK